jgi:hypothetical protein
MTAPLTPFSLEQCDLWWKDGYAACDAGQPQRAHPSYLRHGSPALQAWLQGWEACNNLQTKINQAK